MRAQKCGGLEQRDSTSTDLVSKLFLFALCAVHGSIRATQIAGKKCEEGQIYRTDMREEMNLC